MYYGQEFYLPEAEIPQVFLDADRIMHKRIEKEHPEWLIKRATPKKVPMPIVSGKAKNGPLIVTEDWYVKKKRKQTIKRKKRQKELKLDIMSMQADIKLIEGKLAKLDPHKKKDNRKILKLNEELRDLKCQIEATELVSGGKMEDLEEGSKLLRAWNFVNHKVKKAMKKFRKWVDRNEDLVIGILSVAIPMTIAGLFKWIFKTPAPVVPLNPT